MKFSRELLFVCIFSMSHVSAYAQWQPKNYLMKTDPKYAKGRYWKDSNVWVYTPEFARRFGMPEKWATDELTGAQAVAYRIVFDREETCGWFRDPSACRRSYSCVMDLYTEHDAGLPWKPGAPPMGVRARMSDKSSPYLSPQKRSDFSDWDQEKNQVNDSWDVLGISGQGILAGKPINGNSYSMRSNGSLFVYEYVRNVFPNLDYISFSFSCGNYRRPENFRMRFAGEGESEQLTSELTTAYEVKLPYSYMKRMEAYMKENYEGKSVWDDLKKRLKSK